MINSKLTILSCLCLGVQAKQFYAANVLSNTTTVAEKVSASAGTLDEPKLSPGAANSSSYDWWYFDVASSSSDAQLAVLFYNSGPNGFINQYVDGPFSVTLNGLFDNGTAYAITVPAVGGMSLENDDDGIAAEWLGSGFSFAGSPLASKDPQYTISIDSPASGVYGSITYTARAPAHYPCGPDEAGQIEQILPNVFWANAIPDALVDVNITIGDTAVEFNDGVGYHDKNWGDAPFISVVSSWYWGHASFGPYSVVWFDAIDKSGVEHVSGYVVKDGEVLSSSCGEGAVSVRPWGENSTYPPVAGGGTPQGLIATFDLGCGGQVVANMTLGQSSIANDNYLRAVATVSGSHNGGPVYQGRSMLEQFSL